MWTFLNVIAWVMIGAGLCRELSATAAQICQAGNYFILGEREKMYPKAVSDILLELLMVSLKFEGCKPVEGSGVTGADNMTGACTKL